MSEIKSLNNEFSTTKLLTRMKSYVASSDADTFESVSFLPENKYRLAEGGLRTQGYFKQTRSDKPLVSIVTIVYNGQKHIEETILSVLNQDYDNVEYIVIDGGSTDNTLNIIKKYTSGIDYWVSESDQGISDAFNKGIRCCSGQIVGLINADDYYEKDSFKSIVSSYINLGDHAQSVIYGHTNKITIDGRKQIKNDNKLSWCISVPFSHCSSFLTMAYYKKFGLFNTTFKIGMDVELLMRGLKSANYIGLSEFIATQRDGGVSDRLRLEGYKEYRKIAKNYFGYTLSHLGHLIKIAIFYKNKVLK